jgi:hypothetical protein
VSRRLVALAVTAALTLGCSNDFAGRVISGRVELVGERRNDAGAPEGELRLGQASGVPVFLLQGGRVVQGAVTSFGEFRFFVPNEDAAQIAVRLVGTIGDTVAVAAGRATVSVGTLELESRGSATVWPNPYCACNPAERRLQAYVEIPATDTLCVQLVSASTMLARTLLSGIESGDAVLQFGMVDAQGDTLPAGPYWLVIDRTGSCGATLPSAPDATPPPYEAHLVSFTP